MLYAPTCANNDIDTCRYLEVAQWRAARPSQNGSTRGPRTEGDVMSLKKNAVRQPWYRRVFSRRIIPLIALLALVSIVQITVQAFVPANSAMAPPAASAGHLPTLVNNIAGSPVKIDCNYKHGPYHYLYELRQANADGKGGKQAQSTSFCIDADRIMSTQGRCMQYMGANVRDGWYYLAAKRWVKISSLSMTNVLPYGQGYCSKRRPFPTIR